MTQRPEIPEPLLKDAADHLSPSHVVSFNRVLHEVVSETLNDAGLVADKELEGWKFYVRHSWSDIPGYAGGGPDDRHALILLVPVLFNRARACWNVGCVLDWEPKDGGPDSKQFSGLEDATAIGRLPFAKDTVLAGILYRALEERTPDKRHVPVPFVQVITSEPWKEPGEGRLRFTSEPSLRGDADQRLPAWMPKEGVAHALRGLFDPSMEALKRRYAAYVDGDHDGTHHSILVPIYEFKLFGESAGNLAAVIYLHTFRLDQPHPKLEPETAAQERQTWSGYFEGALAATAKAIVPRIEKASEVLALEVESAALAAVSAEPAQAPYDLLRHFLKVLRHVQYWERAEVLRVGLDGRKPEFAFGWEQEATEGVEPDLERVDKVAGIDLGSRTWSERAAADRDTHADNAAQDKWWPGVVDGSGDDGSDLLTFLRKRPTAINLSEHEAEELENLKLRFQFPKATVVPESGNLRKAYDRALMQQQLEVFRLVLPIVRNRRAALRSAVSAIMGRNMSHNIGSHVTARYATGIRGDRSETPGALPGGGVVADHREDFLRYLQRRMDFIAEIGTVDAAIHVQSFSLEDCLDTLDFREQQRRICPNKDCPLRTGGDGNCSDETCPARVSEFVRRPILLSYISGKEQPTGTPLHATVEYKGREDYCFACPGGETGMQALYVILENIIRNSARHNDTRRDCVRLTVEVDDGDEKLIKLVVTDTGSSVTKEKLDEINSALGEPFLDHLNIPNSKCWGLREMQICAAYLRGIPLTALESPAVLNATPARAKQEKPVIRAGSLENGGATGPLAYEIYLQRPRTLAIVTMDGALGKEWDGKAGAKVVTYEHCDLTLSRFTAIARAVRGFDFVLVDEKFAAYLLSRNISACAPAPWTTLPVNERTASLPVRTFRFVDEDEARTLLGSLLSEPGPRPGAEATDTLEGLFRRFQEAVRGGSRQPCDAQFRYRDNASTWFNVESGARCGEEHDIPDCPLFCWVSHVDDRFFEDDGKAWAAKSEPHRGVCPKSFYIEHVDNLVPQRTVFLEAFPRGSRRSSRRELIAAAFPRVVVLDERIQSATGLTHRGVQLSKLWRGSGTIVPSAQSADLNQPCLSTVLASLASPNTSCRTCPQPRPADFLVVHLTVLEALATGNGGLAGVMSELRRANGVDERTHMVIVTGRGIPSLDGAVGSEVRFLAASTLQEHLIARPSKLGLMRALWSTARVERG